MNSNQILQRGGGILRQTIRLGERIGRGLGNQAYGVVQEARHRRQTPKPDMDDVTLARKVETEVFRNRPGVKATVNVNVVDGVVWLRGQVKRPEQIRSLEAKARAVPEVRGVENLLHLPKTPAPTRADTPARQQGTRSSTKRPTPRRRSGGRVTDDRTDALTPQAEPSPAEHAAKHEGRSPAPLGSTGGGESSEPAPPDHQLPSPGRSS
jgi:osmotically-inducible protein OsmY